MSNFQRVKVLSLTCAMAVLALLGAHVQIKDGLKTREVALLNGDERESNDSNIESKTVLAPKNYIVAKLTHVFPAVNPKGVIVIWGDSMAGSWSPLFQSIGLSEHYTVVRISTPSCLPILNLRKHHSPFPANREYCGTGLIQDEIIDYLKQINPMHVFIAGAWANYNPINGFEFVSDSDFLENSITTAISFDHQFSKTVIELSSFSRVTLIESWPRQLTPIRYGVDRHGWKIPEDLGGNLPYAQHLEMNQYLQPFLTSFGREITYIVPADKLCSQYCQIRYHGSRLYGLDGIHPSEFGVMLFRQEVLRILDA